MPENLHARIDNDFAFHPATDDETKRRHEEIRTIFREAAHRAVDLTPPGRAQSTMVTKLEEAMMHANAAIAREGPVEGD